MPQRRRGEALKTAIYDATVEILEQEGYEAVTFQNVAKKANTTRSVLYRYFDNTFHLIYEASRAHVQKNQKWHGSVMDQEFNTGQMRTDLLAMMTYLRENAALFPKNFLSFIYFEQAQGKRRMDGLLPGVIESNIIIMERILARAQERGEAREKIARAAKLLPFELSRYHIFVENRPISDENLIELIDDILLPLYKK